MKKQTNKMAPVVAQEPQEMQTVIDTWAMPREMQAVIDDLPPMIRMNLGKQIQEVAKQDLYDKMTALQKQIAEVQEILGEKPANNSAKNIGKAEPKGNKAK